MDWLNLHSSVLDSAEFVGSDPVARATWLCLLRYCTGQENAGRIEGGATWGDRKWQQLCRVTKREIHAPSELWSIECEDVVVKFYPIEKEDEVKRNRKNGSRGGRPKQNQVVNHPVNPLDNHPAPGTETDWFVSAETEGKGIGKEEEGNRNDGRVSAEVPSGMPSTEAEAIRFAGLLAVPREFIVERFTACMAVGFVDGLGRPIKSWPYYLQNSYRTAQQRAADAKTGQGQRGPGSGQQNAQARESAWALREREKALREEISQVEAEGKGYRSADQCEPGQFPGPYWKHGAEEKVKGLRAKLRDLQRRLAETNEEEKAE